ncbi:MAG: hypothetical protein AB8H79_01400 [Myxococcota bacterium]
MKLVLLVGFSALVSACGYRDCGSVELVTTDANTQYDPDGDGDVDFSEACGVDVGAYGYHYRDWDLVMMLFDTSHWDIGEAFDVVYDYLPVAQVVVRWSDLQEPGFVAGTDRVSGSALHIVSGDALDFPTDFPLTSARIEVIEPPSEFRRGSTIYQDDEGFRVRLAYDFTFGDEASRYQGEDWIFLTRDGIVYTDLEDFPGLPPDYEAP